MQLDGPYSDSDSQRVLYATDNTSDATKLQFDLNIQNQPQDNRMDGALVGPLTISGELKGKANFDLKFATDLSDNDSDPQVLCSRVTGTASRDEDLKQLDFIVPKDTTGLSQAQVDKCEALTPP